MAEITSENFYKQMIVFNKGMGLTSFVMIRPDRQHDQVHHRYQNIEEREKANMAMKRWFEYLAAKKFIKILNGWRAILKSGRSIMLPCENPEAFDLTFAWPSPPALPADFWDDFELSRVPLDSRYDDQAERERIKCGFADLRHDLERTPGQPKVRGWYTVGSAMHLKEWE